MSGTAPAPDWSGLITIVSPSLSATYEESGTEAYADVKPDGRFDVVNERAAKYAKERSAELVGMKYDDEGNLIENPDAEWAITQTTRDEINRIVTSAFTDGKSPDEVADEIAELIDDPDRAALIADTELADAQSAATMEAWRESGEVEGKGWLVSEDNPCDICEENAAAGVIGLDEAFPSGDDAPTAHARCQCDLYASVIGAEEE